MLIISENLSYPFNLRFFVKQEKLILTDLSIKKIHMKKNISIALTFAAIMTVCKIYAQQEQTLNFMTDTWQAHLTNPALLPS